MKTRRIGALLVVGAVAESVVFAPTVGAQKGAVGFLPAGRYHFSSTNADFSASGLNSSIS
jgi:hypothetical protein